MRLSTIPFLRMSPAMFGMRHYGVNGIIVTFQHWLYLGGMALGTTERIMSYAHVWQNQKQTPQPPKDYNLKERRCSFVPLMRQRNTASISSGTIRVNQAPGRSPSASSYSVSEPGLVATSVCCGGPVKR